MYFVLRRIKTEEGTKYSNNKIDCVHRGNMLFLFTQIFTKKAVFEFKTQIWLWCITYPNLYRPLKNGAHLLSKVMQHHHLQVSVSHNSRVQARISTISARPPSMAICLKSRQKKKSPPPFFFFLLFTPQSGSMKRLNCHRVDGVGLDRLSLKWASGCCHPGRHSLQDRPYLVLAVDSKVWPPIVWLVWPPPPVPSAVRCTKASESHLSTGATSDQPR